MYRFALRPRWLVGHVVVLALVVALASLGLWQLRRLDERRDANAVVRQRSATVAPLDQVVPSPADAALPDTAAFRRITVRGTYDPARETLLRFRTRDGLPGYEVLTPLVVRDNTAVLIDRGWVPLSVGDEPTGAAYAPEAGEVTVTGLLLDGEGGSRFRPEQRGERLVVSAVYVPGLEERLDYDLYPGFVQLQEPDDPGRFPAPLAEPDLGSGPHLTYALQWFSFTAIAAVGWALLIRSSARRRRRRTPDPTSPAH